MHNSALPDLEDEQIDIDALLSLCEAAEKYGNFIALQACKRAMKQRAEKMTQDDSLKVLRFKVCHSDLADIDIIARKTIKMRVKDVWSFYKGYPEVYYYWSRYQIAWADWDSEYSEAMSIYSYHTVHKDTRQCPELEKYLDHTRSLNKRSDGTYTTWDEFNHGCSFVGRLSGIKTICGCGAFGLWKGKIKKAFDGQPRWEDFTV
ncbi:hypothetical protein V5O48_010849 [Marasmius crinis-equi]|uniref:Uncharacterized protein n=1 Tax=Marasmius crinis-equi TaxID=585013 RepID=A0ABR3F785_9AGAR